MDKLENQIAELFSKPNWTVQDWQTIRELLEQQSPGSMQSFFQENYISELAKGVQPPSDKARELLKRIHSKAGIPETIKTPVVSIKKRNYWSRIAVAASILIVAGISSYFLFFNQPTDQNMVVSKVKPADVAAPQSNRAMITLADGSKVYLDSAGNGTLASQSGVNVIKTADGKIVYDGVSRGKIIYNTLNNPRGSKVIDMTLSDGSRVWLNAGSSVTYPVAFVGNERKVTITGEAYFEITHNTSQPFKVTKDDLEVVVLGTHFNVNAYDDESEIKVTLLEGKVRVTNSKFQIPNSTTLIPGQQAVIKQNAAIEKLNTVDIEKIMAWKQNIFMFSGDDLQTIMRQLSRWYNIEVTYKHTNTDRHFTAIINRDNNISEVLKMMQSTGKVNFEIEGRKIIVE